MRRSFTSVLIAGASIALLAGATQALPATGATNDPVDELRRDLNKILDQPGLPEGQASVLVREADGSVLYSRDEIDRLMPASNTKLLTSAAGLEVLGSDHRFPTTVFADGHQQGSVLDGDLYLRGKGDPTLRVRDLNELAAKVAANGIEQVSGRLVADDTWFDDVRYGEGWAWDYEYDYYAAQTSALNLAPEGAYNTGNLIVEARPGAKAGEPAELTTRPKTSYVEFDNQTTTVKNGGTTDISAVREHGSNTIVVSGTIAADSEMVEDWSNVWEPTGYAADVFERALKRQGVEVEGEIGYAKTPADASPLAEHQSMTLGEMLVPWMKLSNNMIAEAVLKEMGAASGEGSWTAGLEAANTALEGLDVDTAQLRYADGSGLSRRDVVSAEQFTNLLLAAEDRPWFDTWYESLPIAGKPSPWVGGTLNERMRGTPAEGNVHAKTGSLTGASGLSGYVTDADGKPLVFSIVHNSYLDNVNPKEVEDQVVVRLARFSRTGNQSLGIPDLPATDYGRTDIECSWVHAC